MQLLALAILLSAVALALLRPSIGRWRCDHAVAAALGAAATVLAGLVPWDLAVQTLVLLAPPVTTIVSLMAITLIAEEAGLLDRVTHGVARLAQGDGRRLFTLVYLAGAATGMLFTNDAAILIFTPLVHALIGRVADETWHEQGRVAFYFAVVYVGNLAGAFVISNPINIVVTSFFEIGFLEYSAWMFLPALASIVVSYLGLRIAFRGQIPLRYRIPGPEAMARQDPGFARVCAAVLGLTLAGFFAQGVTGVPTWAIALTGALALYGLHAARRRSPAAILRRVGWDVVVFVVGMFLIAMGVRNSGLTHELRSFIEFAGGASLAGLEFATALTAGFCSSLMNNHPTAGLMIWVIQDFGLDRFQTRILVYAALIGGDLGPKMLPIGSLAAMMWFRMLRDRGVEMSYAQYVRIGVPVTLAAIVLAVSVLHLEVLAAAAFAEPGAVSLDLPRTSR